MTIEIISEPGLLLTLGIEEVRNHLLMVDTLEFYQKLWNKGWRWGNVNGSVFIPPSPLRHLQIKDTYIVQQMRKFERQMIKNTS